MKIYRLAVDVKAVPIDPNNPNANDRLQNMQQAETSAEKVSTISDKAEVVVNAVKDLEQEIGIGDTGISQTISNQLFEILKKQPDITFLQAQNLLPSIATLFNENDFNMIKTKITNDVQKIQTGIGNQALQTQQVSKQQYKIIRKT